MKGCEYEHRDRIHITSLLIANEPSKLQSYIKIGWKALPGSRINLFKIQRQGLFSQHFISLLVTNGPNKLECYITLGRKVLPGTKTLAY